jgi:biotin carboxylase
VATAAALREHLRLNGLGETVARFFRDKLAMRTQARAAALSVPDFVGLFNDEEVNAFMGRVTPPWVLKPRFEAGAVGIQKLHTAEAVWHALHGLGDQRSFYLLEQFLPGDVFHVDVLRWDNQPVFTVASQYGAPPLSLMQGGGIFITRLLAHEEEDTQKLLNLTRQLHDAFQLDRGVSHTEFIRANADDRFYFLETSARVGGAHIDRMIEAATDIALWTEAARIELASVRGEPYRLPPQRSDYAGLIICLAREQWPDLSSYNDPEVVWRVPRENHAGLIVASPDANRVEQLLTSYAHRFGRDFLAHAPQEKEVRHTI